MRKSRKLSEITKLKISRKMAGKKKSAQHIERISKSMKKYWATIPLEEE